MPPMRWNKAGYFGEKPPRKRYSHTIEQWIIHAAASACSSRASSRPSSRPSSAGSRTSSCTALSQYSQIQTADDVSAMLEKLTKRGSALLDRLPGALSSELMGIVAQGETILAKNLQALLVDTLVDVTKKEAESEKSVKSESGDTTDSEMGGTNRGEGMREDALAEEAQLQELVKSAAEVFERLPSELSEGLLHGVLHGDTPLAALLRRSSDPSPSPAMADMLRDLIASTASLFDSDSLPAELAEEVADVMQASTPLAASLRDAGAHDLSERDSDLDHVAVVSDLVGKLMDSIETRLASDPMSLLGVDEVWSGGSELESRLNPQHDLSKKMVYGAEGSELDPESSRTHASPTAEINEKSSDAGSGGEPEESPRRDIVVKMDGDTLPNTPRTPLTSIPEDETAAWPTGISSVPHSLSTILAVLKFNGLDIATGYDVFDCDQDGRISLRDLRKKCQELDLEMSAEAIVELFQALNDTRTGHISRDAWGESLASGDADSVLAKRGVVPENIQLAHVLQDVIDDMIDSVCRLHERPKSSKKTRGVSFSEEVVQMQERAARLPASPAPDIRVPQINIIQSPSRSRNIRNPPTGMLLEQPADDSRSTQTKSIDYACPQIVVADETVDEDSEGATKTSEMTAKIVTKENMPVSTSPLPGAIGDIGEVQDHLQGAIGDIGEVRDHLQAAQSYLQVGTVQPKDHHQTGRAGDAAQEPREATGIYNLDLSNVANTSLTSSIFTEGGLDLEAMSVPSRPTSARTERPRRRVRPASSKPHLPALALEDNLLYKEFIRFSRGAWTVDIGQVAPAAANAAVPVQPETRKKSANHMELGSFLDFLKWADIVPRLTNSLVAHGVYDCVSRDCAAAGLDGKMGHLGWVGFQQCVGMIAALVCLPQVLSNDVLQLLQASSAKQFGIFPSEVARQECEDGATSAFIEMFASQKNFNRFSSPEPKNKGRTMTLDQAVAVIHALRCNPMFITPSLVAQEFRKVARGSSSAQLVSPRAVNAATIRFEQFRAMMKAICLRIGPCLVIRTVCISLASHSTGVSTHRRDTEEPFDNGAPNPPHKPNPKAFLRPTRPSTAPRGLRPASRPPIEIKAENFLKPAPPKWRPGGHVDLKAPARKTPTRASPSTMLSHSTFKGQNEFDQEELDFQRLCREELGANSSHVKHSLSVSASSQRSRKESPERSLRRLERKAREDYARMLEMNNQVSLHYSIASWIDRTPIQTQGDTNDVVDVHFSGGRVIRGGRAKEPEHLVPTAPAGRDGLRPVRGHKRLCPDPVYESVPVLKTPDHDSVNTSEHRRGEMILRQAHEMANKATSDAISAKKRMATRLGGVQPYFEKGNWYMRSPSIDATSISGVMTRPLAQIESGYRGDMLDGMLMRFRILEEARNRWPAGTGTSQNYAHWMSRKERENIPNRGLW